MSNDHTITCWLPFLTGMENPATGQAAERSLADWTRRLSVGDDAAWRWFHERYYLMLLRYAAHRSGNDSGAGDIVQQAYLRIARHVKPFSAESDFSNWLFCVVRCAAADYTRGSLRRSVLAEKFAHWRASQSDANAGWPAGASQSAELAAEALAKLPDADAALLRRKYCDGSSTEELAGELATTPKAIEHRLARLRGALREIILRLR